MKNVYEIPDLIIKGLKSYIPSSYVDAGIISAISGNSIYRLINDKDSNNLSKSLDIVNSLLPTGILINNSVKSISNLNKLRSSLIKDRSLTSKELSNVSKRLNVLQTPKGEIVLTRKNAVKEPSWSEVSKVIKIPDINSPSKHIKSKVTYYIKEPAIKSEKDMIRMSADNISSERSVVTQLPGITSPGDNSALKKYYNDLKNLINEKGYIGGSLNTISRDLFGGVPHDVEIIIKPENRRELNKILKVTRKDKLPNNLGFRVRSPYAINGTFDVQIKDDFGDVDFLVEKDLLSINKNYNNPEKQARPISALLNPEHAEELEKVLLDKDFKSITELYPNLKFDNEKANKEFLKRLNLPLDYIYKGESKSTLSPKVIKNISEYLNFSNSIKKKKVLDEEIAYQLSPKNYNDVKTPLDLLNVKHKVKVAEARKPVSFKSNFEEGRNLLKDFNKASKEVYPLPEGFSIAEDYLINNKIPKDWNLAKFDEATSRYLSLSAKENLLSNHVDSLSNNIDNILNVLKKNIINLGGEVALNTFITLKDLGNLNKRKEAG